MSENTIVLKKMKREDLDILPLGAYFVRTFEGHTYITTLKEINTCTWYFKNTGKERRFINIMSRYHLPIDDSEIEYVGRITLALEDDEQDAI